MLTQKGRYALKAILYLTEKNTGRPVLISEIADSESIPKKFLESILLELKNHGVLQSKKGKGGGYFLQQNPADITVAEIVTLIDGPIRASGGEDAQTCVIEAVLDEARDAVATILEGTSVADLLEKSRILRASKDGTIAFEI